MSTKDIPENHEPAPLLGLGSSEGLGGWTQLPDGRWAPPPKPEDAPQEVRCWYMRDNHTFRGLPLDVEGALAVMREERDDGQTYGMLCGKPATVLPPVVHASDAARWDEFEAAARPWLEQAVARSKPPNAEVS